MVNSLQLTYTPTYLELHKPGTEACQAHRTQRGMLHAWCMVLCKKGILVKHRLPLVCGPERQCLQRTHCEEEDHKLKEV